MKIVYVYADTEEEWNSSEWRCAIPARALNRTNRHQAHLLGIEEFARQTTAANQLCDWADIIVIQRNLFGPVLGAMQYWKARDKTLVVDFDDAYQLMHPSNLNYSFWLQGISRQPGKLVMDPPPLNQFKWGLRMAHAGVTPSKRLCDDWKAFNDIVYLPNYIELQHYQNNAAEAHDGIIIGWGGSISHLQSFQDSGVIPALKKVCRARPNVKVMVCGNDARVIESIPVSARQKLFHPWVPYQQWPSVLAKFDIGLAPLSGEYDERRSWIKVLEYMVMKIPWVASDYPPYQDFRKHGWLVNNQPDAWERVLLDMVDHLADYKQEAAHEPYLMGLSLSIDENIENVASIYSNIFERVLGKSIILA